MVSIECIERGIANYIDKELLQQLNTGGIKGFGLGMAASLLIKRGGNLLREYAKTPILKQLGLVTDDGAVDLDALRDAAVERMPKAGLAVDLPMGISIRLTDRDVSSLYEYIKRETKV